MLALANLALILPALIFLAAGLTSCSSVSESDTYLQGSDNGGNFSAEIGERLYFSGHTDSKAVKPPAHK